MSLQQLRPSFLLVQFALDYLPPQLSLSQPAADAYQITGPGSGPQDRFAAADFTHNREAHHNIRILRGVTSREDQPESTSRARHAAEKFLKPGPRAGGWQPQRQKEVSRAGTHGGDVTRGASQRLVADDLRGVDFPQ